MKLRIIFMIFIFIFINSQTNEILSFDQAIQIINNVGYTQNDYNNMIKYIKDLFIKYYVYLDIKKNPPYPLKPFDFIKELDSINTAQISYYEFYQKVYTQIKLLQDLTINISFKKISDFYYAGPIQYVIRTENNKTNLYINVHNYCYLYYEQQLCNELNNLREIRIIKINDKNPFDYIEQFGGIQTLKSSHAQFVMNKIGAVISDRFDIYPFQKNDLTDINVQFENNVLFTFNYVIIKNENNNRRLLKSIELGNNISLNNLNSFEKKQNDKENDIRKLETSIWDYYFEGKIKLKIDKENKVNVIYINSFILTNIEEITSNDILDKAAEHYFLLMAKQINQNNYPIIIIDDIVTANHYLYTIMLLNVINSEFSFNILNKAEKNINNSIYDIDDYGNGIKHNRTKIITKDYMNFWAKFTSIKTIKRKPTDIIVFTPGYGVDGYFLHNLQESGNAIIVGYNGNPSDDKKNEKFPHSISFTSDAIIQDDIVDNLKNYGINVNNIPLKEYFDDSFINTNEAPIPKEYKLTLIDERSNIYGEYEDRRYQEFVDEGKRIFLKYKTDCNTNNKNLVLLSDECKFNDDIKIGGYSCINGKWSNICQVSNCKKPYIFNTYTKSCYLSDIKKI